MVAAKVDAPTPRSDVKQVDASRNRAEYLSGPTGLPTSVVFPFTPLVDQDVMDPWVGPHRSKAGDDTMMDVACFCGWVYSVSGDLGVCPNCGDYVTLSRVAVEEERQMRRELDAVLNSHTGLVDPDLTLSEEMTERAGRRGVRRAHSREADAAQRDVP
jgi:hypothetical protein